MSTFKRILAEKSRDYGRKGGQTPTIDGDLLGQHLKKILKERQEELNHLEVAVRDLVQAKILRSTICRQTRC